jgi:hypothetical protein
MALQRGAFIFVLEGLEPQGGFLPLRKRHSVLFLGEKV